MKIIKLSTDEAVLRELGQRLAAARLQQNLTQLQLAEQAGISKSTLQRLESGEAATQLSGFVRVCRALGLLQQFETLLPEPVPSPMAQLKLQGRQRQRASGSKAARHASERARKKWTWGEPE
jgi:transcriptional regulator with XRE-family HTH domain